MSAHPDAELLALCHRLQEMQAEWQRLYDLTSDDGPLTTPEDHAWDRYSDDIWPGTRVSTWSDNPLRPEDLPGRLRELRATTPDGKTAKARAILALEEAATYCECRNDTIELMHSLLRDVAGIETHNLGEDAAKATVR